MASVNTLPGMAPTLAGKTAYVAICGLGMAADLADGLEAAGARVAIITDDTSCFASRSGVEAAFAAVAERVGPADLVVHAAASRALCGAQKLTSFGEAGFRCADTALRATLYALQAAHGQMAGRGGAIVVLGPAMSLVGASNLVPLVTATEGQRALVKSGARQWGRCGITVNWLAAVSELFAAELAGMDPGGPELGEACALGRRPQWAMDIAPVLAFLGSDAGRSITGASINMDGGEWMTP
ncbi:MAG: SDR family oxidoreductase [Azonexus sp.]|jgi:NAD(P)-dependent dehydrogenase (short-subunit alcohol dehydrogenase family)|nr:SDR family oxidoreductase [Azonexus sp.]